MKNKRELKQKFVEKNAHFLQSNVLNFHFNTKYRNREWGRKQVKWETWKLTSDEIEQIAIDYFDMFDYEDEE